MVQSQRRNIMKKLATLIVVALGLAICNAALAEKLKVKLQGYQETPNTLSSPAFGEFEATISPHEDSIAWEMTYGGFPTPVLQSHIHFGQRALSGGISIFLCTNLTNAPPPPATATQSCPTPGGTISGLITSSDVIGPAGQGIAPGELAEIIAAIRAGYAYVNIHTQQFPSGEIRGEFMRGHRGHRHD